MKFDPTAFETNDVSLASIYLQRLVGDGMTQDDFLPYFQEKAASMDSAHLQLALYLLGKLNTTQAWHNLSRYLDHSDFAVKFVAIKMLKTMTFVDAATMKVVVKALSFGSDEPLIQGLAVLLERAETVEAMLIAKEYQANLKNANRLESTSPKFSPNACVIQHLLPTEAPLLRFDPNKFETLTGADASLYALRLEKVGMPEDDFLPYFQKYGAHMAPAHLEVALFLLGTLKSRVAWHLIATYLDHANYQVRFMATKVILRMPAIDEIVMRKVVACLMQVDNDVMIQGLKNELKTVLDKPSDDEARRIADDYLRQNL